MGEWRTPVAGRWMPRVSGFLLGVVASAVSALLHAAIPISDFARMPEYREVSISPGGGHLAAVRRHEAEDYLLILDAKSMRLLYSANFGDSEIGDVWWANDDRLVLQAGYRLPGVANDTELIAVNADGSRRKRLSGLLREDLELLSVLDHDRRKILVVQPARPGSTEVPTAYELDVYSGAMREVAQGRHPRGRFVADLQGNITFTHGRTAGNLIEIFHRLEPDAPFQRLPATVSKDIFVPIFPAGTNVFFTLLLRPGEPDRLVRWNPASGEAALELERPDLESAILHADRAGAVFAVESFGDEPGVTYLDGLHPMAVMHRAISAAFPGNRVVFTSATSELKRAIAHVSGAANPGAYYLVDLQTSTLSELFAGYPWLATDSLAAARTVQIPAPEGQKVRARLTVAAFDKAEPRPGAVLVSDELTLAGFDWRAQLLAAKGYTVLALGIRPSGDQTRSTPEAAQIVLDATRWVIEQEIMLDGQVCTLGAGDGGYAALSAAARAPGLFRCVIADGVDFGRVSNVDALRADGMFAYADGDSEAKRLVRKLAARDMPVEQWLIQPSDDDRIGFYHNALAFLDSRIYPEHPERSEDDDWAGADLVCEKIAETGTRVKRRVCRTRQQMDVERRRAREDLKIRQGMQSGSGTDG